MPRSTEVDGVVFSEEPHEFPSLGSILIKAPTQNTPLSELKRQAAAEAKRLGGNAVVAYTYGQKADATLKDVFGFRWDSERITVTGVVVKLDDESLGKLRNN